jgi:hypothetical protein
METSVQKGTGEYWKHEKHGAASGFRERPEGCGPIRIDEWINELDATTTSPGASHLMGYTMQ